LNIIVFSLTSEKLTSLLINIFNYTVYEYNNDNITNIDERDRWINETNMISQIEEINKLGINNVDELNNIDLQITENQLFSLSIGLNDETNPISLYNLTGITKNLVLLFINDLFLSAKHVIIIFDQLKNGYLRFNELNEINLYLDINTQSVLEINDIVNTLRNIENTLSSFPEAQSFSNSINNLISSIDSLLNVNTYCGDGIAINIETNPLITPPGFYENDYTFLNPDDLINLIRSVFKFKRFFRNWYSLIYADTHINNPNPLPITDNLNFLIGLLRLTKKLRCVQYNN